MSSESSAILSIGQMKSAKSVANHLHVVYIPTAVYMQVMGMLGDSLVQARPHYAHNLGDYTVVSPDWSLGLR